MDVRGARCLARRVLCLAGPPAERPGRLREAAVGTLTRCAELGASQKRVAIDGAMLVKNLCERAATVLDPEASAKVSEIATEILEAIKTGLTTTNTARSVEELQQEISVTHDQIKSFRAEFWSRWPDVTIEPWIG